MTGGLKTGRRVLRRLNERFILRSFALDRLDVQLRPCLRPDDAFFIEAGANDGIERSNTLDRQRYRGWRGLLVEPFPELAARCRVNRPRCIVENAVLVAFDHPSDTVVMRYRDLMSAAKGGMKSQAEDLARGIARVLGDEERRRGLGDRARHKTEQEFELTRVAQRHVDRYGEVMDRARVA